MVRYGELELFHGHGLADIASNTPVTEDTVSRIASITKTFTAIAVMQLWEQGSIDLDAPAIPALMRFGSAYHYYPSVSLLAREMTFLFA